ncbi:MAG: NAD(P)-dependent oxidoreductase [Lachnospiraceae bacterium]|nr:NAD(P)-dependent oxidoreductase [Lachnospiraceae bacterium]
MKIAVVGGNGFIGKEFIRYASEQGHQTMVIGSSVDAFSDSGSRQISELLSESDAVVFLAAKRSTADFSLEEYYYNIRLAGTYFEYIRKSGVKNVVITSSISVYSSLELPWKEKEWDCPLSLYGASKQAIDGLALYYNHLYGMKIKSLRLAQVVGMGERKGFLLNTLIDNAILGRKQTIYGTGAGRRQYIYIKDVCDALLHSITAQADQAGVFNIGLDYNISVIELAQLINDVFENKAGIEILSDKPEDTKQYLMDVTKAELELHWKPKHDLQRAFTRIKENC